MTNEAPANPEIPETPDLTQLLKPQTAETPQVARNKVIQEVLASHKLLSAQYSRIDHPLASEDQRDDYEIALEEFEALIGRVVVLPQSVEGIEYLRRWYGHRIGQIDQIMAHAKTGVVLRFGDDGPQVEMTEDFAKGVRAGLHAVKGFFEPYPLVLTCD